MSRPLPWNCSDRYYILHVMSKSRVVCKNYANVAYSFLLTEAKACAATLAELRYTERNIQVCFIIYHILVRVIARYAW